MIRALFHCFHFLLNNFNISSYDYVIFLSGTTYPIKSNSYIKKYLHLLNYNLLLKNMKDYEGDILKYIRNYYSKGEIEDTYNQIGDSSLAPTYVSASSSYLLPGIYLDYHPKPSKPEAHRYYKYVECDKKMHRVSRLNMLRGNKILVINKLL